MKIFTRNKPEDHPDLMNISIKDLIKSAYNLVVEPVFVQVGVKKDLTQIVIEAIMNKEQTQKFQFVLSPEVALTIARVINEQLGKVEGKVQ